MHATIALSVGEAVVDWNLLNIDLYLCLLKRVAIICSKKQILTLNVSIKVLKETFADQSSGHVSLCCFSPSCTVLSMHFASVCTGLKVSFFSSSNRRTSHRSNNRDTHALTTVFCKMSVRRSKYCREFPITWGRLQISRWPFHYSDHVQFSKPV